jgi:hypothetical protein
MKLAQKIKKRKRKKDAPVEVYVGYFIYIFDHCHGNGPLH